MRHVKKRFYMKARHTLIGMTRFWHHLTLLRGVVSKHPENCITTVVILQIMCL